MKKVRFALCTLGTGNLFAQGSVYGIRFQRHVTTAPAKVTVQKRCDFRYPEGGSDPRKLLGGSSAKKWDTDLNGC